MEINQVYNIDCLKAMKKLSSSSVDLIYLDPPFFTQRTHKLTSKNGKEYFFEDNWVSIEEYKQFLKIRFFEMKRILKETGNIFVHCDRTASHIIRTLLEEVFGVSNFQNEIIWSYKRWSNSKRGLLDSHQNIYHFSKSKKYKFNVLYTEYSLTTNIDQILQDRVRNSDGKSTYKKDENGKTVYTNIKKGVPLNDVWEIPFLNPKAKERVGYPTQKPIQLLEKIIEISSDEGDLVLDPFLGSGTCAAAAKLLNRNYIGFDINENAIKLAKERLIKPIKTESNLLKNGISSYDNKTEKEKMILSRYDCDIVQRNKGLDGILREKIDGKSVGIKIQKENEILNESEKLLLNAMKVKNFDLGILIRTHSDLIEHCLSDNIILIDDIDYVLQKRK
ncbi:MULTISPECIES: site-specific DNA-methyltransferase [Terrabacteria group]|uniref:DNA-methyltransferase n=1 Tax=Bacillati TaxID=1783272 RepID=UPI001C6F1341|nr:MULTISPECIES: site-specific DNA-methyltransferase [Terrabacteria group]MBW9212550.1 site-specific DNA-methyltransferase [Trueperella sp. zg.1013]